MKTYIFKKDKLWRGAEVSVRDYIVELCIKNKEPLRIVWKGKTMTIPVDKLPNYTTTGKRFKSLNPMSGGIEDYSLYDYEWKEDK